MPNPLFRPGQTLTAAELQQLGNDDDYTPTLIAETTNPTLGPGAVQDGKIWLNGQNVQVWITIGFGSSGVAVGAGNYAITLPALYPIAAGFFDVSLGTGRLVDTSAGAERPAVAVGNRPNNVIWLRDTTTGTLFGPANPWTWEVNDSMSAHVSYITDFGV